MLRSTRIEYSFNSIGESSIAFMSVKLESSIHDGRFSKLLLLMFGQRDLCNIMPKSAMPRRNPRRTLLSESTVFKLDISS
jgi:hypothetical protein